MNIFSNIGITELIFILVLALLVVGPERLPELARSLAKGLRDLRRAYENLTKDLGPEMMSIQQTTQELRESIDSVRSIPRDVVQTVVKAADLEETTQELKALTQDLGQVGQTLAGATQAVRDPLDATLSAARDALRPAAPAPGKGEATAAVEESPQPIPAPDPETPETGPSEEEVAGADRVRDLRAREIDSDEDPQMEDLANG